MPHNVSITALPAIVNPTQLVNVWAVAELFDDPVYRHERYLGTIDEVKINARGTFVRFKPEAGPCKIVGKKWLPLHKILGLAAYETQTAIA